MSLSSEIQARFPEQRLIQLTNSSGSATSVNTTVLDAAINDAQGHFRRVLGVPPDYTEDWQMSLLVQGVLAYLEYYKGGDYSSADKHMEMFDRALYNLRQRAGMTWETSSKLNPSTDTEGALPDFDRNGPLQVLKMQPNNRVINPLSSED